MCHMERGHAAGAHALQVSCISCLLFTFCKSKVRVFTQDLYSDSSLYLPDPAPHNVNIKLVGSETSLSAPFRSSTTTESPQITRV